MTTITTINFNHMQNNFISTDGNLALASNLKEPKMKTLFVHIEGQADFYMPWGVLYTPGAEKLIPVTDRFIEQAVKGGAINHTLSTGDYHVEQEYLDCTYSDEGKSFPLHCVPGTPGFKHVIKFPAKNMTRLHKKDTSMWHQSATINNMPAQKIIAAKWSPMNWDIVMGGLCSDICVAYAAKGFMDRGYNVTILTDLVQGYQQEMPEYAAENFAEYLARKQLRLMTSAQFIKQKTA